jgi:hypothetical protein
VNLKDVRRIQIRSTRQQEDILKEVAAAAQSELGPWCLAQLMAAANCQADKSPVVISGDVGDRLRAASSAHGITPSKYLEQLLMAPALTPPPARRR